MRTFLRMLLADPRHSRRCGRAPGAPGPATHGRFAADSGFMLVEVIISSLLVALVVVATFNGFDAANRLTIDQRRHAQAALLAAESNEQLRTDPATALDALELTPHSYEKEIGGTKYKITQEAQPLNGSGTGSSSCTGKEASERGTNIEITSSVTWALLEKASRPAVRQASIITPPTGSALEIDVNNGGTPPTGVTGVTAIAKFTPEGSATQNSAEGTTGSSGCIFLTGLAATSAIVEILEKANFVTEGGELKYPTKEISIAPNITTTDNVVYNEGGSIRAEYTYKGATTFEGKTVEGNTFVASNESIPAGDPPFQTGSPAFSYALTGEHEYEAGANAYAATASTAKGPGYAKGDLFPFPSNWTVFAGDCPKNKTGTETTTGKVNPGAETPVKVPLTIVKLNVDKGTYEKRAEATPEVTPTPAVLTDVECEGYEKPNNAFAAAVRHEQETEVGGHLSHPFQPFGKQKLCVFHKGATTAENKTFTSTYTNSTPEGISRTVYLNERSKTEREAEEKVIKEKREKEEKAAQTAKGEREAAEALAAPLRAKRATEEAEAKIAQEKREKEEVEAATAKSKRETEEAAAKTAKEKREKEETEAATAKTAREKKEAEEREKWKKEEKEKKLTLKQREEKEAAQKKARETAEAAEKTAKEKRAKEETEAKAAKEKREKEETEAAKAKETRVKEEATAKAAREKRIKEESEAASAKEKRIAEEAAAKAAKEKRLKEEAEATPLREKRETEEAAAKAPREKREKEESEAPAIAEKHAKEEKETEEKTGIAVASGATSC